MTAASVSDEANVSRETAKRLHCHLALVEKWNPHINLVAKSSIGEAWRRHIQDSLQLYLHRPADYRRWADLGSGAGFPGLVIAAVARDDPAGPEVICIEADQRKATFLRHVSREADIPAIVLDARIEKVPPQNADVVSARALAPLPALLGFVHRHLAPAGVALLPKGARWAEEVALARKMWSFDLEAIPSRTEPDAAILRIGALARA